MDRPYITDLRIQNYGCVLDAHLQLSPLHALIGPNDSGKSTILGALQSVIERRDSGSPSRHAEQHRIPGKTLIVEVSVTKGYWWHWGISAGNPPVRSEKLELRAEQSVVQQSNGPAAPGELREATRAVRLVHLDPNVLREPAELLKGSEPIALRSPRGDGLAALLDAIRDRADGSFEAITEALRKHFSSIRYLQLARDDAGRKAVAVELHSGARVSAENLSEGLLYFIALLAVRYSELPSVLLIEEPENGLHPARIADVMGVLREISKTTQVLLATHSPFVINELRPEEVSVVVRDPERGTQVTRIDQTPNFEQRSKAYALGELWVSYANGIDEASLLKGGPRP